MITVLETTHNVQMNTRELYVIIKALELLRDCNDTENDEYQEARTILKVLRGES